MTKRINGTKSSTNKAGFKRVILALVVFLLSATLMVGAVSAEAVEEQNEPAAQTTWYVNASVAESGVGTSAETAFKTMAGAVTEAVKNGGTIELLSDITSTVTIETENDVSIVINGNGKNISVNSGHGIVLNGTSLSLTLNDLNVKSPSQAISVPRLTNQVKSLVIEGGSYMTSTKAAGAGGINVAVIESITVRDAEIGGALRAFVDSNTDIIITGNDISYPDEFGNVGLAGIWLASSNGFTVETAKELCDQIYEDNDFLFDKKSGWYVHLTDDWKATNIRGLGTPDFAAAELNGLQYQFLDDGKTADNVNDASKGALAYAEDGDTITLLSAVELADPLTIDKAITLTCDDGVTITAPVLRINSSGVELNTINFIQNGATHGSTDTTYTYGAIEVTSGVGNGWVKVINSTITTQEGFVGFAEVTGTNFDVTFTGNTVKAGTGKMSRAVYIDAEANNKYVFKDNIFGGAEYQFGFHQYLPDSSLKADISNNYWGGNAPSLELFKGNAPIESVTSLQGLVGANVYYTALKDGKIDVNSLTSKVEPKTQGNLTMSEGTTETSFTIEDAGDGASTITFDNNKPTELNIDYGSDIIVTVTTDGTVPITKDTTAGANPVYFIPVGSTITATYPAETYVAPSPENTAAGTMTYDLEIGLNTVVKDLPVITSTFDSAVVNAVDDANEHVDVFGMINGEYPQGSTSNDNVTQVIITFKIPVGWKDGANINKFVVYHCDGVKAVPCTISERNTIGGFYVITVIGNGFSSYAIGYDTYVAQSSSSPSSSTGTSEWLTETPTQQPTQQPTATQTPTDTVPTDVPTTSKPTEEPSSPGFGILAALAGLGAVAVLRRK